MTDARQTDQATNWRAVWRLLKPYWVSEERWKARGLLATRGGAGAWHGRSQRAVQRVEPGFLTTRWKARTFVTFKAQLWRFSYLAFIYIGVAIYKVYLTQAL